MTKREPDARNIGAPEYIRGNFQPSDRIAVFVRNAKGGATIQRISTATLVASNQFQDWMHVKNDHDGCDIYVGMNALKPNAFTRTKSDILAIRHLYVDLDRDGSASLQAIENSARVPPPNYVLNTSPDKYQTIWKIEGCDILQAETLLRALARDFDGDRAATDAARVLRIPGFSNKKYETDFRVTARQHTDRVYHIQDFKVRTETVESDYRQPRHVARMFVSSEPRIVTQSERDWAYVKTALANGADPEQLITTLAESRANDKSDPEYYARLTVRKALADLESQQVGTGYSSDLNPHADTEH